MTSTYKTYPWATKWYVMTYRFTNAAGMPTAQCGPFKTEPEATSALIARREKTGDETLLLVQRDINKLAVRPTRLE